MNDLSAEEDGGDVMDMSSTPVVVPEEIVAAVDSFEVPGGYVREPVPAKSHRRSIIYDYGVKCSRLDSTDPKEGYMWFCMASHVCRVKSIHGQGIAIKGSISNCTNHLRDIHGVISARSLKRRRIEDAAPRRLAPPPTSPIIYPPPVIANTPDRPLNPFVCSMLTDMYQITMTYAYWKSGRHNDEATFELFFRKNPFGGEFCIFAGLEEVLRFISSFRFSAEDVTYIRRLLPNCEDEFFAYLQSLDCSGLQVYAMREGSLVFPKEPLIRIDGPLVVGQLLETTLLNLINYPSLIATNAARMRLAVGPKKQLLEFGLRRAQGPDGGVSASKYSYVGGFDGTSNVLASMLYGIPARGTHAHSFVMCYSSFDDITSPMLKTAAGEEVDFVKSVLDLREKLQCADTNTGELAAFTAYAQAFPDKFLALVDTYDTLQSGVWNFIVVGAALLDAGYHPVGIRLDSGDLAYLSTQARLQFRQADEMLNYRQVFSKCTIVASNDINEDVLIHMSRSKHEIDTFAVGTHLVTCQKQPALGCVYKLVEINGHARIKISQDIEKIVIPTRKQVYRLTGAGAEYPLIDVLQRHSDEPPAVGRRMLCRHPFQENKRAHITPANVEPLLRLVWDANGRIEPARSIEEIKAYCQTQLCRIREDHIRSLNPTPYKVSVSVDLYDYMHQLWMTEAPITDLS